MKRKSGTVDRYRIGHGGTLKALLDADDVDGFYEQIQTLRFGRYPAFRKPEQKELSQEIKPLRDDAKIGRAIESHLPVSTS